MSQRGAGASQSQPDYQLSGHHVTQYLPHIAQRDETHLQNFKACRDTIMDAAQLYADEKDQAKLDKLRSQFVRLIQQEHQVLQHKAALTQLHGSYQPSLEKTDFEEVLRQHMQQVQASDRFDAEADEDLVEFDELAGNSSTQQQQQAQQQQQQQDLDDDEDLVVVGDVEKNERCPYTRKRLAELDEPLEDQMGFIYEAAAIRGAIAAEQRNRYGAHNWVECPMPGASHQIALHNLKPVNKRRLQRLARQKQQQQQQAGTQAGHGRVVLDA